MSGGGTAVGRGASLTSPGVEKLRVSVSGGGTAVGRGRRSPLRGGEAACLRVWGRHCSGDGGVAHLSGVEKLRVSVSGGGAAVRRGASLTSPGWRSCVSPCLGEELQWGGGRRSPLRGGEAARLRVWGRRCSEEGGVTHLSGVEKLRVSVSGGGTAVRRGASLTSPGWRSCESPCLGGGALQ